MKLPAWPPRDWRMMVALLFLAISGCGAWLLAVKSLHELATLSAKANAVWPLAYYAYGALGVLSLATGGLAMVVALKSFRVELPGGTGFSADGDNGADAPRVTTTTTTEVKAPRSTQGE